VDDGGFDCPPLSFGASCLCVVWMYGEEEERLTAGTTTAFPAALQHTHIELLYTHRLLHRGRQFAHYPQYSQASSRSSSTPSRDQVQRYHGRGRQPDISRDTLLLSHATHSVGRACMNDPTHALPPSPGTNIPSVALPNTAQKLFPRPPVPLLSAPSFAPAFNHLPLLCVLLTAP